MGLAVVSTRFRQIKKLKIVKLFHARHDELIVVELTCVGVQTSFLAWCQLHYGDMYVVVHFFAVRHRFHCSARVKLLVIGCLVLCLLLLSDEFGAPHDFVFRDPLATGVHATFRL